MCLDQLRIGKCHRGLGHDAESHPAHLIPHPAPNVALSLTNEDSLTGAAHEPQPVGNPSAQPLHAGRVGAGMLVNPVEQRSRFLGPTRELKKTLARFTGSSVMTSSPRRPGYSSP